MRMPRVLFKQMALGLNGTNIAQIENASYLQRTGKKTRKWANISMKNAFVFKIMRIDDSMSKNKVINYVYNGNWIGIGHKWTCSYFICLFAGCKCNFLISTVSTAWMLWFIIIELCVQEIRMPLTGAQQMHICLHYTNVHHNLLWYLCDVLSAWDTFDACFQYIF